MQHVPLSFRTHPGIFLLSHVSGLVSLPIGWTLSVVLRPPHSVKSLASLMFQLLKGEEPPLSPAAPQGSSSGTCGRFISTVQMLTSDWMPSLLTDIQPTGRPYLVPLQ